MDEALLRPMRAVDSNTLYHLGDLTGPRAEKALPGPFGLGLGRPLGSGLIAGNHEKPTDRRLAPYYRSLFPRIVGMRRSWWSSQLVIEDVLDG